MMSVLVQLDKTGCLFVKGAPESVLDRCTNILIPGGHQIPLTPLLRNRLQARSTSYAQSGRRTLAFAFIDVQDVDIHHYHLESTADYSRFERNLTFVSLVVMLDPPRPEARDADSACILLAFAWCVSRAITRELRKASVGALGFLAQMKT